MAAGKFDLKDLERRMRGSIDSLKKEYEDLTQKFNELRKTHPLKK